MDTLHGGQGEDTYMALGILLNAFAFLLAMFVTAVSADQSEQPQKRPHSYEVDEDNECWKRDASLM